MRFAFHLLLQAEGGKLKKKKESQCQSSRAFHFAFIWNKKLLVSYTSQKAIVNETYPCIALDEVYNSQMSFHCLQISMGTFLVANSHSQT